MEESGQKKRRGRRDAYVFISFCLVSFSCLVFSTRSFFVDFRNVGFSVFSGLRIGAHSFLGYISGVVNSINELANLRRDYTELSERIERYEILKKSAAEIRQENYRLREQLGFSLSLRYKHIVAEISGRDPDNLFQAFSINKGKKHGITENMSVIAYQNGTEALVGKVVQTGAFESLVMPVYHYSSFVPARFASSRHEGIVEGQSSPDKPLIMRFIPKQARSEIHEGDVIVTSGLGGIFPAGITIGRTSKLLSNEDLTSFEAELLITIDFSRLEYVFVLAPETEHFEIDNEAN